MTDAVKQQSRLKDLIAKGKEQGYLTYAEVNDHLPQDISDPDQVEDIIQMINDMGIQVFEVAPDADELLMAEGDASADDIAAAEAAAALAAVETEAGRTTDPVRMYMREMGTVELLTRAGEIEIAKRIEAGLSQMISSLATYPDTIATVLALHDKVMLEEVKLTDIISTFVDPNAPDDIPTPAEIAARNEKKGQDDDDDEVVDTGPDPEEAKQRFARLRKHHSKLVTLNSKHGHMDKKTIKVRDAMLEEFMQLKLTPKMIDRKSVV